MLWYVKIAKFGIIVDDATTWHPTKNACIAFIAISAVSGKHNLPITTFFYGKDGQEAEEVNFTSKGGKDGAIK